MEIKKLKIYLDTSVINFLFADDAPEKKEITITFFEKIVNNISDYTIFISDIVISEIEATKDNIKKEALLDIVTKYPINFIEDVTLDEISDLAVEYINNGIIPKKNRADALHVAICSYYNIDVLATWNFKHLANIKRKMKIESTNILNGYLHKLEIVTPTEVIYDENE
jgi:predicted nucleic acid-binding protein